MTEQNSAPQPKARSETKASGVQKLLGRAKGGSLAEIIGATGWQAHSARAFLTGLRKKGMNLIRECRANGETSWRIER